MNPHITPKGCSLPTKLSTFQPGLSVWSISRWPEKVELFWIIFNWRLKASHNEMIWELGLTEKQKMWNDFGLNPKKPEYCAYTSWISSKFRLFIQPKPSSCKTAWCPTFQPAWYLCYSWTSFHRSTAFEHYGISALWHSRVSLWASRGCVTLHNLSRLFPPGLQSLSMSPVQGEGDEHRSTGRSVWTEGQGSVRSLKPLCSPLSKQNCCSGSKTQKLLHYRNESYGKGFPSSRVIFKILSRKTNW